MACNVGMVSTNGLIAREESSWRGWEEDEARLSQGREKRLKRVWNREGPWKRLEAAGGQR